MRKHTKILLSLLVVGMLILSMAGACSALSVTINLPDFIEEDKIAYGNITLKNVTTDNQFADYTLEILCPDPEMKINITDPWDLGGTITYISNTSVYAKMDTSMTGSYVTGSDGTELCKFSMYIPSSHKNSSFTISLREIYSGPMMFGKEHPLTISTSNNLYTNLPGTGTDKFYPALNPATITVKTTTTTNLTFIPDSAGFTNFTGYISNGDTAVTTTGNLTPTKAGEVFTGWYLDENGGVQLLDSVGNLIDSSGSTATQPWVSADGKWQGSPNFKDLNLTAHYAVLGFTTLHFNPADGTSKFDRTIYLQDTQVGAGSGSLTPNRPGFNFTGWYVENTDVCPIGPTGALVNTPGYVVNSKWANTSSEVNLTARYTLDLTGTNLSGVTVTQNYSTGEYTITLGSDIKATVSIPDTWGNVTLNLNNHNIIPGTDGEDGLVFTSIGAGSTNLTVTGKGLISGANGKSPNVPGGAGIGAGTGTDCSLVINSDVTVAGGNGADGADNSTGDAVAGTNGGHGIGAANLKSLLIEGLVSGGNGGKGGTTTNESSAAGNGGNGGNASIFTPTNLNNGTIRGGSGGNGGNAVNGTAGDGGNGGSAASGTVNVAGKSSVYNGVGGAAGTKKNGGSGTPGSDGQEPAGITTDPNTVISVVSNDQGTAEEFHEVVVEDLSVAIPPLNDSSSYRIDMIVVGNMSQGSFYDFVKGQSPNSEIVFIDNITIYKKNLTAGTISEQINKTEDVLQLFIEYKGANSKDIFVYRQHDGKNETLTGDGAKVDGHYYTDALGVYIYAQNFSYYAIAVAPKSPSPSPTQSSKTYVDTKQQGISQILPSNAYAEYTPQPTTTPTPSGTTLPIPTSTGSKYPYFPTTHSPAPVAGVLLGLLGGAAVVFGLRRKQQ